MGNGAAASLLIVALATAAAATSCGGLLVSKDAAATDVGTDAGTDGLRDAPAGDRGMPEGGGPPADLDTSLSPFELALVALPADSWFEALDTKMRAVCAPDSFGVNGVSGCSAIISAWGGGTWDPVHRKFLVWGGGHNDYWGNEVYAFDLPSGKWERLTDPSPAPFGKDPLDDGNPVSRHTYDGLAFITHAKRLFGQAGARAKDGNSTALTWVFDVDGKSWKNQAPAKSGPGGYSLAATYDPKTRVVIARAVKNLQSYDYDTNIWTPLVGFGFPPLWPRYEVSGDKSSTVDTKRGLFWSVGNNDVLIWDITAKKIVTDNWRTTGGGSYSNAKRVSGRAEQLFESGGGEIFDAKAPGFDYDARADQIVAWKGGAAFVLDLASKTWTKKSASGAPAKQAKNGTYGRFAYLAAYNVFMLVNGVDDNLFFYKNTAGP